MHSSNFQSPSRTRNMTSFAAGSTSSYISKFETTSLKRNQSGSIVSNSSTKKKKAPKPYEPIRLPEDILTIQAHTCSTPVTELPYLLIAAHIGALPTTRQFYPATTSTHTPLTVFRDMFVMTVDVRGYKPNSIRLSTEGHLIIIECLQSEVPQVVHTQTGTIDANEEYIMDPTPKLNSMPVHTSFNYVQHRVKLPDDFSEEGLKVGMDDVSGHIIITGRLVHNQHSAFPELWNKNKVVKKSRGPIVNTSSINLNKEDARKLAAWQAVQGTSQDKSTELVNTNLLEYGRKQWLEKEGAKLRAIQHKALKTNIKKLTEMKKNNANIKSFDHDLKTYQEINSHSSQIQKINVKSSSESKETLSENYREANQNNQTESNSIPKNVQSKAQVTCSKVTKLTSTSSIVTKGNGNEKHVKDSSPSCDPNPSKNKAICPKNDKLHVKDASRKDVDRGSRLLTKKSNIVSDSLKKKLLNKLLNGKNEKEKFKKKSKTPQSQSEESGNKSPKKKKNKIETPSTDTEMLNMGAEAVSDTISVPEYIKEQMRTNLNFVSNQTVVENEGSIAQLNSYKLTPTQKLFEGSQAEQSPIKYNVGQLQIQAGYKADSNSENLSKATTVPDVYTPALETFNLVLNQHLSKNENPNQDENNLSEHHSQAVLQLGDIQKRIRAGATGIKDPNDDDPVGYQDKIMWESMLNMASTHRRAKSTRNAST